MTVTVLGVMVPTIIVHGVDGVPLPAEGWLVRLTLTEESRQGAQPEIRKCDSTKTTPSNDFNQAARDAFRCWSSDRGDVVWRLEACRGRQLPPLNGPSLGAAFAVALTLLHYRGSNGATSRLDKQFANSVMFADFSEIVLSASVRAPAATPEAIELGAVGELDWKEMALAGRALVVSTRQPEIGGEDRIPVDTVKQAIDQVFERQAYMIVKEI